MKRFASITLSLVWLVACGGDDGGGGSTVRDQFGQCAGQEGQTCTGIDEYNKCINEKCATELKAALGDEYASGKFTGPCGKLIDCFNGCPCDSNARSCQQQCVDKYMADATCQQALGAVATCVENAPCTEPTCTSSGGGGGGEGCEKLHSCCDELIKTQPTMEAACTSYKQLTDETQCQAILSTVMAPAGFCK